jgi:hypothetical protein
MGALPYTTTELISKKLAENAIRTAVMEIENQCGNTFHYLFQLLLNDKVPYEIKMKEAIKIIRTLDWRSASATLTIGCIVIMLAVLFALQSPGFYILIKAIIKAIREGKISRQVARLLIRKLMRNYKEIPIDPDLLIILEEK